MFVFRILAQKKAKEDYEATISSETPPSKQKQSSSQNHESQKTAKIPSEFTKQRPKPSVVVEKSAARLSLEEQLLSARPKADTPEGMSHLDAILARNGLGCYISSDFSKGGPRTADERLMDERMIEAHRMQMDERRMDDRKLDDRRSDDRRLDDRRVDDRRMDDRRMDVRRMDDRRIDDRKVDDRKTDDRRTDDRRTDDRRLSSPSHTPSHTPVRPNPENRIVTESKQRGAGEQAVSSEGSSKSEGSSSTKSSRPPSTASSTVSHRSILQQQHKQISNMSSSNMSSINSVCIAPSLFTFLGLCPILLENILTLLTQTVH